MEAARATALQRLRGHEARHVLRRWWTRKYRLPPTSDEYLRYTPEELLIEFFEDALDRDGAGVRALTDEHTGATYYETGDALVDQWEREIAAGREPDLDEAAPIEERTAGAERRAVIDRIEAQARDFDGIDERWDE